MLKHVVLVNKKQISICKKLGVDVKNCSLGLARAKIDDFFAVNFYSGNKLGKPTEKQILFAKKFDINIKGMTKREANAVIDDIMSELDTESIISQQLAPGTPVRNRWDTLNTIQVISSIRDDGTVFFKGGNGKHAWARSLIRVEG